MIFVLKHLNEFWPGLVLCLVVGQLLVIFPYGKRAIESFAPGRWRRTFIGLLLGGTFFVGWTKGPISIHHHVAQFITALSTGGIVDESGLVVTGTEEEAVAAFADLSDTINTAASQTVVNAADDFAEVAGLVTNVERQVIYIQSALPRTDPTQGIINHNISAFPLRTSMNNDRSVISRFVWYSQQPLVAPTVVCCVDVGGGEVTLAAITNTFPDTVEINGIDCVRYDYAVPEGLRNVVFFPDAELSFGSEDIPLEVGESGISVEVDEIAHLPFTGTDTNFNGRVQIDFKGGIATACRIDGVAVTNGVYRL